MEKCIFSQLFQIKKDGLKGFWDCRHLLFLLIIHIKYLDLASEQRWPLWISRQLSSIEIEWTFEIRLLIIPSLWAKFIRSFEYRSPCYNPIICFTECSCCRYFKIIIPPLIWIYYQYIEAICFLTFIKWEVYYHSDALVLNVFSILKHVSTWSSHCW